MSNKYLKNIFVFLLIFINVHMLCTELVLDKSGQYRLDRQNDVVVLVHEDLTNHTQTVRALPPSLFPLQAIIETGSVTNQDIIQNRVSVVADHVTFNVNDFTLMNGLIIKGRDISIRNALIDPTITFTSTFDTHGTFIEEGINVLSGSQDITIESCTVRNARRGIRYQNVAGGSIKNCEVSYTVTGIELNQSDNIVLDNTLASCNKNAGFCLLSSTTNCLRDCKAISTGERNTQTADATIFGFVSTDGHGNIFERCIANSTQALSTTDFNSLVAGFALRGSESCTKIIDSESANATTSVEGVTIPYGILLEATLNNPITLTGVPPIPIPVDVVRSVDWSLDGKYLAAGIDSGDSQRIRIYQLDRANNTLTQVATPDVIPGGNVQSVAWSPDGTFLAAGAATSPYIHIYQFDRANSTLTQVATPDVIPGSTAFSVDWSPDGKFLAAGAATSPFIRIYQFDRVNSTLTQVATPDVIPGSLVFSVDWSPDGKFLAAGIFSGDLERIRIYQFDRASSTLTQVATPDVIPGSNVFSVDWSPDGKFLAAGTADSQGIRIYQFDRANSTLTQVATPDVVPGSTVFSVDWSPDGKFLAAGIAASPFIRIYQFDRGNNTLTQMATPDVIPGNDVNSVAWFPDGTLLAVGIDSTDIDRIKLYETLTFPSKNLIKNNIVYCNSGNSCPGGVGISGSSICNLIIGNTAYSNPLLRQGSGGQASVSTNYAFVTNIFNQLFGDAPSALQNISLGGCEPICTPADIPLLAKQLKAKVCLNDSQLDEIETIIDSLKNTCSVTQISAPTTIAASGIYCLSQMIAGPIQINASDVELDLSNRRVTGGISVTSNQNQVTIMNGTVSNANSDAIKLNAGVSDVTLMNLIARDSQIGINVEETTGALIKNCEMSLNTTGIELDRSHKIVLESCTANCNTNAGFCLLSSTTNCLRDCKALSTGEGNLQTSNQTIFGFVATDGNGNIFERCIANSTQALLTTDFNSLVAGFALRGSESCTKIIDSESANATTSVEGVTIPYGILLENSIDTENGKLVEQDSRNLSASSNVFNLGLDWSSDGKYLLAASNTGDTPRTVFLFEAVITCTSLDLVELDNFQPGATLTPVTKWSPDDNFFVVAGPDSTIFVYEFDRINNTVTLVDSLLVSLTLIDVDWSPVNDFIIVGANTGSPTIILFEFDRVNKKITRLADNSGEGADDQIESIEWSPDGRFILVGYGETRTAGSLRVILFDEGNKQVGSDFVTNGSHLSGDEPVNGVSWTADGKYIACSGNVGPSELIVFRFNPNGTTAAERLVSLVALSAGGDNLEKNMWSPDGKFLAVAVNQSRPTNNVRVYEFNRVDTLTQVATVDFGDETANVRWSPTGDYIAVSGSPGGSSNKTLAVYDALTFPQINVIKNNTVYCNSGGGPCGIGISGSSIANYIVGNTAYSNPIPQTNIEGGGPIVPTNYAFVTNVFNQLFGTGPTGLQNISIGGCEPICTPDDEILLAKQFCAKVAQLGACGPTALTSLDISGGTISITESGGYCLSTGLTTDIAITATCVILDLNNYCLTGRISVATSDDVEIINGSITPPAPTSTPGAAISMLSTVNRTMIEGVQIICVASTGDGITGRDGIKTNGNVTLIRNCTIVAGDASDRTTSGAGASGGHGILLSSDATQTIIQDCVISSGNGGDANTSGLGGDAGDGIQVSADARDSKIMNSLIFSTGTGGTGVSAAGGAGGDGIKIASGAVDTEVRDCRIRNTGAGGSGSTAGADGKAVDDDVTNASNLSVVFSNFAHNIASATKFDLQATGIESGILTPNPPTSTVINPFANVFT